MGAGTRGHSGSVIAHVSKTPGDERDPALPMMTEVDRNKGHDGVGPDGLKANTEASSVWRGWREGWGVLPGVCKALLPSQLFLTVRIYPGRGSAFLNTGDLRATLRLTAWRYRGPVILLPTL